MTKTVLEFVSGLDDADEDLGGQLAWARTMTLAVFERARLDCCLCPRFYASVPDLAVSELFPGQHKKSAAFSAVQSSFHLVPSIGHAVAWYWLLSAPLQQRYSSNMDSD